MIFNLWLAGMLIFLVYFWCFVWSPEKEAELKHPNHKWVYVLISIFMAASWPAVMTAAFLPRRKK